MGNMKLPPISKSDLRRYIFATSEIFWRSAYLWCGLLGPEALLPTLTSSSGSGSLLVVSSVNLVSSDLEAIV